MPRRSAKRPRPTLRFVTPKTSPPCRHCTGCACTLGEHELPSPGRTVEAPARALLLPGRADHGPGQGNGRPTAADDLGSRLSNPAWTPFTASPLCAEMGDGKQLAIVISRRRCQSFEFEAELGAAVA